MDRLDHAPYRHIHPLLKGRVLRDQRARAPDHSADAGKGAQAVDGVYIEHTLQRVVHDARRRRPGGVLHPRWLGRRVPSRRRGSRRSERTGPRRSPRRHWNVIAGNRIVGDQVRIVDCTVLAPRKCSAGVAVEALHPVLHRLRCRIGGTEGRSLQRGIQDKEGTFAFGESEGGALDAEIADAADQQKVEDLDVIERPVGLEDGKRRSFALGEVVRGKAAAEIGWEIVNQLELLSGDRAAVAPRGGSDGNELGTPLIAVAGCWAYRCSSFAPSRCRCRRWQSKARSPGSCWG
jgi:hypothetical protein